MIFITTSIELLYTHWFEILFQIIFLVFHY